MISGLVGTPPTASSPAADVWSGRAVQGVSSALADVVLKAPKIAKIAKPTQDRNYERSRGIWTNLFGWSKKNSEENSEE
jgi:hypothetical protein